MSKSGVDIQSPQLPDPPGIVSVNTRGGSNRGMAGKLAFIIFIGILIFVSAAAGLARYRESQKVKDAAGKTGAAAEAQPASTGKHRLFNTDPPPLPGTAAVKSAAAAPRAGDCADSQSGQPLLGPDGKQILAPSGQPIRVCGNGQVIVPAVIPLPGELNHPIAVLPNAVPTPAQTGQRVPASRYAGDVLVPSSSGATQSVPLDPQNPYIQALLRTSPPTGNGAAFPGLDAPAAVPQAASYQSVPGSLPKGSDTKAISAAMIGDRDMILPEGRSIDCNLSVRIVSEVSGKATCVLSSNVYSDSGRVVLAERGSTAVGEYVATTAQGQRRLFVLWTRLQTPNGVVINVNSPAADALGTSGLPGAVDNRWSERIGAAVLLSLVEDAIGYETAKAANSDGSGAQGVALFQSTTQTGRSLAERILDSTINIKPTIYKQQGDRATIFVSRDLDFGSVYALRAK